MPDSFDIEPYLDWEDGLPRPNWDLIDATTSNDEKSLHEFWTNAARHWLQILRDSLDDKYSITESPNFLCLESVETLAPFAEHCRSAIGRRLNGVAEFPGYGKQVVIAFRKQREYYRYVSLYTPEGEQGASAGMHIREGYGHVVLVGPEKWGREAILAHEMTHVALQHLGMPLWVEEGLTQMMEHDLTGRNLLEMTSEKANRHKRLWLESGLEEFWSGDGFHRMGEVQELSYQLAEILMRLLLEEHRPRWFGWSRSAERKLIEFLRTARQEDSGAEASRLHLGRELKDIAAMFLGDAARSSGE